MPSEEMVRFLCRADVSASVADFDELFFAKTPTPTPATTAVNPHDADFIGVCRTPKGTIPESANDREAFEAAVDAASIDVRWFDDPL